MSKYTFHGLAAIFLAAGNAAKAYADGAEESAPGDTTAATETPSGRGRGRPKKEEPVNNAGAAAGVSDATRFETNKVLIEPLIKSGQGAAVKAVIAKFSTTGLKDIPADKQDDFEKDIDALTY